MRARAASLVDDDIGGQRGSVVVADAVVRVVVLARVVVVVVVMITQSTVSRQPSWLMQHNRYREAARLSFSVHARWSSLH